MPIEELHLRERIKAAFELSKGSVGARTITDMVTAEGIAPSRYQAGSRMTLLGLVSSQQPKHQHKKAEQPHVDIPNLLERQFDAIAPDSVWAGDITDIWTGKHWGYLAMVLDLYVRKPVGWAISLNPDDQEGTHYGL